MPSPRTLGEMVKLMAPAPSVARAAGAPRPAAATRVRMGTVRKRGRDITSDDLRWRWAYDSPAGGGSPRPSCNFQARNSTPTGPSGGQHRARHSIVQPLVLDRLAALDASDARSRAPQARGASRRLRPSWRAPPSPFQDVMRADRPARGAKPPGCE